MELDISQIMAVLPHRYPFLFIDRVIAGVPGLCLIAAYNVSISAPFFQGHFPSDPVMPGFLITEALAQAAGLLFDSENTAGKTPRLGRADNVRFSKVVRPGDVLRLEVAIKRQRGDVIKIDARAVVGKEVACSCELTLTLVDSNGDNGETAIVDIGRAAERGFAPIPGIKE